MDSFEHTASSDGTGSLLTFKHKTCYHVKKKGEALKAPDTPFSSFTTFFVDNSR